MKTKVKLEPEKIQPVLMECVLMPNGEIIHQGKTVGWYKDCKKFLYAIEAEVK